MRMIRFSRATMSAILRNPALPILVSRMERKDSRCRIKIAGTASLLMAVFFARDSLDRVAFRGTRRNTLEEN